MRGLENWILEVEELFSWVTEKKLYNLWVPEKRKIIIAGDII